MAGTIQITTYTFQILDLSVLDLDKCVVGPFSIDATEERAGKNISPNENGFPEAEH